jgi:hypothetical protein
LADTLPLLVYALIQLLNQLFEFPFVVNQPTDFIVASCQRFPELGRFLVRLIGCHLAHDDPLPSVLDFKHASIISLYHGCCLLGSPELVLQEQNLTCLKIDLLVESLEVLLQFFN